MTIIMHDATGFYNLTKTSTLFQRLKQEDQAAEPGLNAGNGASGNSQRPKSAGKQPADWFRNRDTNEKLAECARLNGITVEACSFIINDGDNAHTGTYIHPDLYDHFVMWLSPKYSMRVSKMLQQHHDAANIKIIGEKDDKIDQLRADVAELKQLNTDQSAQIAELLGHAKEQNVRLGDVQDDLIETKETAKAALSHLEHKSFVSTMNPQNESKHHYFVALSKTDGDVTLTKLISGQRSYVDGQICKAAVEGFEVELEPFYNANGIDLRQNATAAFVQRRQDIIDAVNAQRALDDQAFNDGLKTEIREFNKGKPHNQKRLFRDEKQITPKLRKSDIPVSFGALKIRYVKNEYITFKEVIKIVVDANNITQTSPMSSPKVTGKKEVKAE